MNRPLDDRAMWRGLMNNRPRGEAKIALRAPVRRAQSSGARAFLGIADDGSEYWFKLPGNPQGNQVLVNEVIVAGVGGLIGAPVCVRKLALVDPASAAWSGAVSARRGGQLVAHASLHISGAVDDDAIAYTRRDDNARRQGSLLALWDWCVGDDEQWLYDASNSSSIWSYDHGLWFTTGEGDWDDSVLQTLLPIDGAFKNPPAGLNRDRLLSVADQLDAVDAEQLLSVMSEVPVEWGASDNALEGMCWFLYSRAPAVAARLRAMAS